MVEPASPNKYREISQRLIRQAGDELQKGDLIQASEKTWGAVAHAVKAIAAQRGWNHQTHSLLFDVSGQIADELGRPGLRLLFRSASLMHQNYYEDYMPTDEVQSGVDSAETYLRELETAQAELPEEFVPQTPVQAARLRRLTEP
jgi:uncharacterized protein (UPF0332 family)